VDATTSKAASAPPNTWFTKFFYGFGSVAYGVKDNGFQTFLLLYYNQVVGLKAEVVGAAIGLALVIDSVMDPMVGQISDNWRSRWGRRHPFMYAAALPVAVSYLLLWNPPHLAPDALFVYLLVVAVIVRTFITFYEIPSAALVAELTDNYDQRTSFLSYRYFFGWWGGLGMTLAAYQIFLAPTAKYKFGQLNPEGYAHYGLTAAIVMFLAIMISSIGTHGRIPYLRQPPADGPKTVIATVKQMASTLSNRPFLVIAVVGLFAATGQGLNFALSIYFSTYFWALTSGQISLLILNVLLGALFATVAAPMISARLGKKWSTIFMLGSAVAVGCTPLLLRLFDLAPQNGSPWLLPFLMAFGIYQATMGIGAAILISSMIADVVEDSELKTGRRSEGLFFAANGFVLKAVSGAGLFLSGLILAIAHFPIGAKPSEIAPDVLRNFALIYVPSYAGLYATALFCLLFYKIDRGVHEANLRKLAVATATLEEAEEAGLPRP
jgi:Na+/melibiose symporter-like transporter